MTEEELMKTWCPEFSSPDNMVKCCGSRCAMFRTEDAEHRALPKLPPGFGVGASTHAYCGLAGKPHS